MKADNRCHWISIAIQKMKNLERQIVKIESLKLDNLLQGTQNIRYDGRLWTDARLEEHIKKLKRRVNRTMRFIESGKKLEESKTLQAVNRINCRVIGRIHVGRNAKGSHKLYHNHKNSNFSYLHSRVRGGSLVMCTEKDLDRGCTLAILYSKHFRTLGTTEGLVDISKDVMPASQPGSFFFKNSQYRYHLVKNNPLYLKLGRVLQLTFEKSLEGDYYEVCVRDGEPARKCLDEYRLNGLGLSRAMKHSILEALPIDWRHLKKC